MTPGRKAGALAGVALAAALCLAALRERPAAGPSLREAPPATPATGAVAMQPSRDVVAARSPAAPSVAASGREDSLRGTTVDGAIHRDGAGRVVADRDLRRLFDYFLARLGERDPGAIRADLAAYLARALGDDAAGQAQVLAWFDAYVRTEQAAVALPRGADLVDEAARLRAFHRGELGDALARAWYGRDDDYAAYTAQRLALERDASLTPEARAQALDALRAQADPAMLAGVDAATDFQLAVAQSQHFDASATAAPQRHDERAALWGEAAAQRLDQLDRDDAAWRARAAQYARGRAALLADAGLSASAREAALQALLQGYSEPEQRRLLALAEVGLLPPP